MGRTALLPIASAVGLQVAFSNEVWARVENNSYRRTFSADVREQAQIAWQEYVDEAVFAEPLSVAERKVEKVKKALEKAWSVLRQELMGGGDASFFAGHVISKHLPAPPRSESCDAVDTPPQETGDFFKSMFADDLSLGHRYVRSICSIHQSNVRACELAENELKELRARRKADDRGIYRSQRMEEVDQAVGQHIDRGRLSSVGPEGRRVRFRCLGLGDASLRSQIGGQRAL